MTDQEKQSHLVGNFSEMVSVTNLFLSEFKKIFGNNEVRKILPTAEGVYMYAIIMHLGKIFSVSKNEPFSLDKFKSNFLQLNDKVDEIYNSHKDIIGKVKNNCDKLFAHTDKDFSKLGFSQIHVDNLKKTWDTNFSRIQAVSKDQERYTPADLHADLVEVKEMIKKVDQFWKDALQLIDFDSTK